jgi:hypothetical protein
MVNNGDWWWLLVINGWLMWVKQCHSAINPPCLGLVSTYHLTKRGHVGDGKHDIVFSTLCCIYHRKSWLPSLFHHWEWNHLGTYIPKYVIISYLMPIVSSHLCYLTPLRSRATHCLVHEDFTGPCLFSSVFRSECMHLSSQPLLTRHLQKDGRRTAGEGLTNKSSMVAKAAATAIAATCRCYRPCSSASCRAAAVSWPAHRESNGMEPGFPLR